jgi:hypothetical protein
MFQRSCENHWLAKDNRRKETYHRTSENLTVVCHTIYNSTDHNVCGMKMLNTCFSTGHTNHRTSPFTEYYVFWVVTPCSPGNTYRRFGTTCSKFLLNAGTYQTTRRHLTEDSNFSKIAATRNSKLTTGCFNLLELQIHWLSLYNASDSTQSYSRLKPKLNLSLGDSWSSGPAENTSPLPHLGPLS